MAEIERKGRKREREHHEELMSEIEKGKQEKSSRLKEEVTKQQRQSRIR